jgi:membrane protein implicated in regulation of membrane protease activity
MDFFQDLDPMLKTLWFVALPATLIFLIQTIMTFAGAETHDGLSADFNSDLDGGDAPFQLFTFRNMINFLLGFGWTGISFYYIIESRIVLIAISLAVGAAFVVFFFIVIRQVERLAEDNTFKISHTLDKTASVYLPIPGWKKGSGKIQVSVKGSLHELDAITEDEKIETSTLVRIVKIEGNSLVVVKRI